MARTSGGIEIRDSSIRLSFTLDGLRQRHTLMMNGKPMLPTPANLKYAHRLIAEICERIRTGTFSIAEYFPASGIQTVITVSSWLETWIKTKRVEKSTRSAYKAGTKFWSEAAVDEKGGVLGSMTLRTVKHSHVLTCIANRPDLSGKTVNNYISILRAAFDLAVTERMVSFNPVEGVPRANYQKPLPDPFSRDETDLIIGEAERAYSGNIHNMVEAWFWTGLRTSEILGLEWKNVDFLNGKMLVASALVAGEQKDRTKTSVARLVNLNSRALSALQRHCKDRGDGNTYAVERKVMCAAPMHDPPRERDIANHVCQDRQEITEKQTGKTGTDCVYARFESPKHRCLPRLSSRMLPQHFSSR